jgi:hypothetical protein
MRKANRDPRATPDEAGSFELPSQQHAVIRRQLECGELAAFAERLMPLQDLLLLEQLVASAPDSPPPEYASVWQQVRSAASAVRLNSLLSTGVDRLET